jgi:hypothetical protein
MGYYIDLEKITLNDYRSKLESAYLPPSRLILKEKLDERFGYLASIGIRNVKVLIATLRKKDKLEELSKAECLSSDYLTILLRELNSTLPKPNKLKEFTGVSRDTIEKLEKIGIKNTFSFYNMVLSNNDRKKLSALTGISDKDILELTKLTDLSRIKWAGAKFARILYDLGIDSVEKVSKSDPNHLHARINQFNKNTGFYKGNIGLNDIRIFVDAAKEIPIEIDY